MKKKEIAQQFTKQMLDPNQQSISFEQVTNMLGIQDMQSLLQKQFT